jgi:hypothetical protein
MIARYRRHSSGSTSRAVDDRSKHQPDHRDVLRPDPCAQLTGGARAEQPSAQAVLAH